MKPMFEKLTEEEQIVVEAMRQGRIDAMNRKGVYDPRAVSEEEFAADVIAAINKHREGNATAASLTCIQCGSIPGEPCKRDHREPDCWAEEQSRCARP